MTPKLILTDLDGTLLDDQKRLSPANREALERGAAAGAHVVLSTGRFYPGVPKELRDLPFLRYFILLNGAKVYDRQEDRVLYRAEIDLARAEEVFDYLAPLDMMVDCYQNDVGLIDRRCQQRLEYFVPDYESRRLVVQNRVPVDDFRATVRAGGDTVQKIQCYFPHIELRPRVMELLAKDFPELVQSTSLPHNLELNHPKATKGQALEALCRELGLSPADAVAFGDGTNDRSMLACAGVGVAMANAAPETLAVADLVAPRNTEDGVAKVLEQWFPAKK